MNNIELDSNKKLRDIPLFSELTIEQLRKVTEFSKVKKFQKNDFLFHEGDFYIGFFILLKGSVKVYKINADGKESVVHLIKPFNAFADIPLFDGINYPASAKSIEESLVLFISKERFLILIKENPEIMLKMLSGFAKRLKSLVNKIEDLSSKEIPNRLAKYLINEIRIAGTEKLPEPFVKLSIPKSTIASFLGTITETLSRTFKKLQDEGIIRVNGINIFVRDIKRLKEMAK
ncbi:MAG: Crp/Fnr family transcriptional regulator [Ignavibacteria bacterium]|nr:Crp/Fnr family transcriptional regulator [Ignavibacteria bacterium]